MSHDYDGGCWYYSDWGEDEKNKKTIFYAKFLKVGGDHMASFVIHHISAEHFLNSLENNLGIQFTEEEKNIFFLGNLIVDSSRIKKGFPENATDEEKKTLKKQFRILDQEEKIKTHFRDEEDLKLCIQAPCLEKFLDKYNGSFDTCDNSNKLSLIANLGYFFHLFTDKMFFKDLFESSFEVLDSNGDPAILISDIDKVRVKKDNKLYSVDEFWSSSVGTLHHDYTIMNKILLEYYGVSFDKDILLSLIDSFTNLDPKIEEVDYRNVSSVIKKTCIFIEDSYKVEGSKLSVFDEGMVINFIDMVSDRFIDEYRNLIELVFKDRKLCRKKTRSNNIYMTQ